MLYDSFNQISIRNRKKERKTERKKEKERKQGKRKKIKT